MRPPHQDEIRPALHLIFAGPTPAHTHQQVEEFLAFAQARDLDLQPLRVVEANGKIVLAMLSVTSPGRTALLLGPPALIDKSLEPLLGQLVEHLCGNLAAQGVHLAQVLLDPAETSLARLYGGASFILMAELLYLYTMVRRGLSEPPALPDGFHWHSYSAETHPLFADAILASYQDSLDCPALTGLRHIDDIIAGHKSAGQFDPRLWLVLGEGPGDASDHPLAVLLLSVSPPADSVELVYLGLIPEARKRKIGTAGAKISEIAMRHALWTVSKFGYGRLSCAVDSRNVPAMKLYYRHGMQRVGSKLALMRDLRTAAPAQPG